MSETQKTETSASGQDVQSSSADSMIHDTPDMTTAREDANSSEKISLSKEDAGRDGASTQIPNPPDYDRDDKNFDKPEIFQSKWGEIYNFLAKIGPLYILLFICLMVWPDYWQKGTGLFCPPEIRSVTAYLHCIQESSWLAPMAMDNGVWAIPQWPLFYLFIGLLALIPGLAEANWLIPLVCASSAAIAVLGAFFFTHAAGFGSRVAFAASLILLCAPIFAPLHHFFGPVSLATGLMLFSLAFFCRGWKAQRAWLSLPLAFICAGLAGLCGGVLYIAVPLLGSFFYLVWLGKYRRGQAMDAVSGFLLMLIIIGVWIGMIALGNYPESYLSNLFRDSISLSWPPSHLWYLAFIAGLAGILPWTLSIFGVSWIRVLKDSVKSFAASRHENGSALMWISLVLVCCLSLFVPHTPLVAITIASLLAPLLGKAFIRLSPLGNRFFFLLASLFVIFIGGVLVALHFENSQNLIFAHLPVQPPAFAGAELQNLTGILVIGIVLIVAGLLGFFFVKRSRGGGGMIYASIVAVAICQIVLFMIAPVLHENPALPLKTMDAIASEVEKAKSAPPAPKVSHEGAANAQPETPVKEEPPLAAPPAPSAPDNAQSVNPERLPNLPIPEEKELQKPQESLPPVQIPEEQTPPASENNLPGEERGTSGETSQKPADITETPPDMTEAPKKQAEDVIIVDKIIPPKQE